MLFDISRTFFGGSVKHLFFYSVHEDRDSITCSTINSSITTTTISTNHLPEEKSFPNPYLLPSLPEQVNNAISLKQLEKFEKLCNFRAVVIDVVFHDLKTTYNLL